MLNPYTTVNYARRKLSDVEADLFADRPEEAKRLREIVQDLVQAEMALLNEAAEKEDAA